MNLFQLDLLLPYCLTISQLNRRRASIVLATVTALDLLAMALFYALLRWNQKLKEKGIDSMTLSQRYQVTYERCIRNQRNEKSARKLCILTVSFSLNGQLQCSLRSADESRKNRLLSFHHYDDIKLQTYHI